MSVGEGLHENWKIAISVKGSGRRQDPPTTQSPTPAPENAGCPILLHEWRAYVFLALVQLQSISFEAERPESTFEMAQSRKCMIYT